MSGPAPYRDFTVFKADRPHPGILRIWIDTGVPNNGVTHENHPEFGRIWRAVAEEDDVRVVLVRGVNGVFCGGGDPSFLGPLVDSHRTRATVYEDIRALVLNLIDCPKPVVCAVEGLCSGAGLAVAIMADISVVARSATLIDSHHMAGLACGDHAVMSWPLLMGMAKSKYHLLTATALSGEEAERNGLVALCVDDEELHDRALKVAQRLAALPGDAASQTKRALNSWYRMAQPIFEQAAAQEAFGFAGDTVRMIAGKPAAAA